MDLDVLPSIAHGVPSGLGHSLGIIFYRWFFADIFIGAHTIIVSIFYTVQLISSLICISAMQITPVVGIIKGKHVL